MNLPSPAAAIAAETDAMQALCDLLQREQACLGRSDADGCAALLDDKAVLVARLATLAGERHARLAAAGHAGDENGMKDWLETSPAAVADWQALLAVARDAHELNRINGLLLGQLAARNRQALDALGVQAASGLYGPGGHENYSAPRAARVIG